MKLSERIEAAEASLIEKKDSLSELLSALEASPDDDVLLTQVDEVTEQVETATKSLDSLKRAEKALAEKAAASAQITKDGAPAIVTQMKRREQKPEDLIFKQATASFIAFAQKKDIRQVIEERYSDDTALKAVMSLDTKSAVLPADTSTTGWAKELVTEGVWGFLDSLKNVSVAAAVASRATQLNFNGNGTVKVPRRNPVGANPTEPAWVGEGGAIPLTQFSFGSTTINRFKLAAITTHTVELAQQATPQIEALLKDGLREAYVQVLDNAFLSAAAPVGGVRPAGILNGVVAGTPTGGGNIAAVIGDIKTLVSAMVTNNMGAKPVLIVNSVDRLSASMMASTLNEFAFRDELSQGRLMGLDVVSSNNVPLHTAILVDAAAMATAFDAPEFDVSDVATVVEASANATAPTMAVKADGTKGTAGEVLQDGGIMVTEDATRAAAAGVVGYHARSLWQTYSVNDNEPLDARRQAA